MSFVVKSIISRLSYRVINPTYFTISGFLFFYGLNAMTDCFPKMKKRLRTVLIPFVLWNVIVVLESLFFSHNPFTKEFFNFNLLDKYHSLSTVLTPPLMQAFNLGHLDIAFFTLGGTIAIKSELQSVRTFLSKPIVAASAAIYLGLSFTWDFFLPNHFRGEEYLSILFSACGMITVWRGYDSLSHITNLENNHLLQTLTNYSFFIYLFHEPVLFVIMQLGTSLLGVNSRSLSFLYIINPILVIILAIIVAKTIKTIVPSLYSVLTGGRITRFQSR